ncbi:type II toxin-antitoxin system RelB/DinJ family antitoxin [Salmonella enterica subsp. enterica serovar Teko]|uniref:type II toxin-antitoxin system RelB/DinJ family antitoxin n=1 Tax=Escherichia coli TaxID=562 RepID=UPI000CFE252A|nr:type II toxin-antitoxin system RelB/DinJ family antitoxin [Escherichia coli]HAM3921878.1 type II toxin-antitoxin system RelB/DinJ family antitoxin [Escherichia coli]HBC2947464.1 type II toxin-antitoxin system RelB/DinJ family antitoxin [Escherichia coli O146]HBC2957580.1 type II toxin-antitoxin system RelB/DinJ family antitoxin [Escherichia coli O146]
METYIRTRVDNVLKSQFETILQDCGLSVSAALRLFAENVVRNEGLPFEITRKPSARLRESMRQTEELMAQGRPGFENVGELIASMNNGEQ